MVFDIDPLYSRSNVPSWNIDPFFNGVVRFTSSEINVIGETRLLSHHHKCITPWPWSFLLYFWVNPSSTPHSPHHLYIVSIEVKIHVYIPLFILRLNKSPHQIKRLRLYSSTPFFTPWTTSTTITFTTFSFHINQKDNIIAAIEMQRDSVWGVISEPTDNYREPAATPLTNHLTLLPTLPPPTLIPTPLATTTLMQPPPLTAPQNWVKPTS